MNIGIDFGGVISLNPPAWEKAIIAAQEQGNNVYIVSHSLPGEDAKRRRDFADACLCYDRTFWHVPPDREDLICACKIEVCRRENIELFIDDYWNRCQAVAEAIPTCAVFYVPERVGGLGLQFLKGLGLAS